MKVLIITQLFDPEPALIPGLGFANELARRGHDVQVVTSFPNYPGGKIYPGNSWSLLARERIGSVHVNRVPLYPSHDRSPGKRMATYTSFGLAAATIGTWATWRQDVTYVYHPPPSAGLAALLWKLIRSAPYVYHIQDMWPESVINSGMAGSATIRQILRYGINAWCNLLYRHAAAIPVISPGFKAMLEERGVPSGKIEVIYNWSDESVFGPTSSFSFPSALPRSDIDNPFTILYAGNLGHYQGLEIAIRAVAQLKHLTRLRLVLMGSGVAAAQLQKLAQNLQASNVVFAGQHPQTAMGATMRQASVLLVSLQDLPFFASTIPSKTQAAMACGRPILMAARGDAADLVRRADAGVCASPGDQQSMIEAIRFLYALPKPRLDALGANGAAYYREHLSLQQGVSRMESLLINAVAAHLVARPSTPSAPSSTPSIAEPAPLSHSAPTTTTDYLPERQA